MSWLQERRDRKRFMQKLRIDRLDKSVGFEVSYPEADLPTIRIVRNPNDSLGWRPWVALGFPGEKVLGSDGFNDGYPWAETAAGSARACKRDASDRLYGIYLAKLERGHEITV